MLTKGSGGSSTRNIHPLMKKEKEIVRKSSRLKDFFQITRLLCKNLEIGVKILLCEGLSSHIRTHCLASPGHTHYCKLRSSAGSGNMFEAETSSNQFMDIKIIIIIIIGSSLSRGAEPGAGT